MSLQLYSRVALVNDCFAAQGATCGAVAYIIEIYPDGAYEIEFSNADGTTYAQVVARDADIREAPLPAPALESNSARR